MKSFVLLVLFAACAVQAVEWHELRSMMPRRMKSIVQERRNEGFIVGGQQATIGQFPHQAFIILDFFGFCGGSLISDTMLLTAAQCVEGITDFEVHLGAQSLSNELEPGRVIVQTRFAIMHENFDNVTLINDVGLVNLINPVSGPNIGTIRLPSRSQESESFDGTAITISGWGRPNNTFPQLTEQLRYANTVVISNTECVAAYPSVIQPCHICYSTLNGTVSICQGDAGGPMITTESDGIVTLIGVTSFLSDGGCEDALPNGASRLTCHLDWLQLNAGVTIRP